jgi:hypothetical protein
VIPKGVDAPRAGAPGEPPPLPNIAGFVATVSIILIYVLLVSVWHPGVLGSVLLGVMLGGLIFRVPYTVAAWSALTVLVAVALALATSSAALAESLGNYAYYCLVVGCVWAFWGAVAERFHWRLPATTLQERSFPRFRLLKRRRCPIILHQTRPSEENSSRV